ncbi:MAG: class I SAM-dependent methyltransferase [Phycisphaerae bacterium]|jgi:hypothetical protein
MQNWIADIEFEKFSPLARASKTLLINPFANYAPSGMLRWLLKMTRSELAEANWADPGGWRSMVISYDGRPRQWADKLLVGSGTIPTALRNRRVLAARIIARLIDQCPRQPAEVLCVGAGPGQIIMDALSQARLESLATLVDLSDAAHDHARSSARKRGLDGRLKFIKGDVCNISSMLAGYRPDIVKMIGICEYIPDEPLVAIVRSLAAVMPAGAPVVANSLSRSHGTDRFFRRVFGLHMIHRSDVQLQAILATAGFGSFFSVPEPLKVYDVIVARRQG